MENSHSSEENGQEEQEQPLISHLIEVRWRLIRCVVGVFGVFLALAPFSDKIYTLLAGPLLQYLPEQSTMIAIEVASPFFAPFKLTLVLAVMLSIPLLLYHFWRFVAPGLYSNERKLIFPLLIGSTVLFYLGMAFAYFVVFPLVFGFLTTTAPEGVAVMTDISQYLNFILTLFFAFGLCFEVPIATIVLIWSGVISRKSLSEKRPYVIVGAFVLGMLLTPPDAISQTLLALPMWILFEMGLLLSRFFKKSGGDGEAALYSGNDTE